MKDTNYEFTFFLLTNIFFIFSFNIVIEFQTVLEYDTLGYRYSRFPTLCFPSHR